MTAGRIVPVGLSRRGKVFPPVLLTDARQGVSGSLPGALRFCTMYETV